MVTVGRFTAYSGGKIGALVPLVGDTELRGAKRAPSVAVALRCLPLIRWGDFRRRLAGSGSASPPSSSSLLDASGVCETVSAPQSASVVAPPTEHGKPFVMKVRVKSTPYRWFLAFFK